MALREAAMSVMMSVMKTSAKKPAKPKAREKAAPVLPSIFTVRDMNRNSRVVLDAAKFHGQVTIRSRNGEEFKVQPLAVATAGPKPDFVERMRLHRIRMRELGFVGPKTEAGLERINRIIAGEE
jgi:hypothetical protein